MRPAVKMIDPVLPPGICFRCRVGNSAPREFFVDTGVSFDWEGVLYLCDMCIIDIGKAAESFYTKAVLDDLLSIQADSAESGYCITKKRDEFYSWALTIGLDLFTLEKSFDERERDRGAIVEADATAGTTSEPTAIPIRDVELPAIDPTLTFSFAGLRLD